MWIYTHHTLALRNRQPEDISGVNRAILELAAAMHTDLDIVDTDLSMLREKQLKERIDKEIRGGAVSYIDPNTTLKSFSIWTGFKTWFKTDKWWFLAIFITSTACSTLWYAPSGSLWFWLWSVWFGQFCAFCIGTTVGSRLLIILFCGATG